mgnify:FL=1
MLVRGDFYEKNRVSDIMSFLSGSVCVLFGMCRNGASYRIHQGGIFMFLTIRLKKLFAALFCAALLVCGFAGTQRILPAGTEPEEGVTVPIMMYHSVLKNPASSGTYVISPNALEADLKFLSEQGYQTVVMQDLIDFCKEKKPLPEKPVVLTFDDGYLNNMTYALPLLEQYNAKAVISIVGEYTDLYTKTPDEHVSYAHLSWEHCRKLQKSGRIELQNHSDLLHHLKGRKGSFKKSGESTVQYQEMLSEDLNNMQKKMLQELGAPANTYTYPYGSIANDSIPVIRALGFSASLSCCEGINKLTGSEEELFLLKRCLRSDRRSVEKIFHEFHLI